MQKCSVFSEPSTRNSPPGLRSGLDTQTPAVTQRQLLTGFARGRRNVAIVEVN